MYVLLGHIINESQALDTCSRCSKGGHRNPAKVASVRPVFLLFARTEKKAT